MEDTEDNIQITQQQDNTDLRHQEYYTDAGNDSIAVVEDNFASPSEDGEDTITKKTSEETKETKKRGRKGLAHEKQWSTGEIKKLIDLWAEKEVLYNSAIPDYGNKKKKQIAIQEISSELQLSEDVVLKKMNSLRSYYGLIKSTHNQKRTGWGADKKPKKPTWPFFESLGFLNNYWVPRKSNTDFTIEDAKKEGRSPKETKVRSSSAQNAIGASPSKKIRIGSSHVKEEVSPASSSGKSGLGNSTVQDATGTPSTMKMRLIGNSPPNSPSQNVFHGYQLAECNVQSGSKVAHQKLDEDEDELFCRCLAASIRKIPNGEAKEELKIDIQKMVLQAKRKEFLF